MMKIPGSFWPRLRRSYRITGSTSPGKNVVAHAIGRGFNTIPHPYPAGHGVWKTLPVTVVPRAVPWQSTKAKVAAQHWGAGDMNRQKEYPTPTRRAWCLGNPANHSGSTRCSVAISEG